VDINVSRVSVGGATARFGRALKVESPADLVKEEKGGGLHWRGTALVRSDVLARGGRGRGYLRARNRESDRVSGLGGMYEYLKGRRRGREPLCELGKRGGNSTTVRNVKEV